MLERMITLRNHLALTSCWHEFALLCEERRALSLNFLCCKWELFASRSPRARSQFGVKK